MTATDTRFKLARWRTARRVVLSSVVLAGSVATGTAVMMRMSAHDCARQHHVERAYTYSGIGVVIEVERDEVVVTRVLPDSPAEGRLRAGARLISVDGEVPATLENWADAIRGAPGTTVELEVAYPPCGGHKRVTLDRDIVRVEY